MSAVFAMLDTVLLTVGQVLGVVYTTVLDLLGYAGVLLLVVAYAWLAWFAFGLVSLAVAALYRSEWLYEKGVAIQDWFYGIFGVQPTVNVDEFLEPRPFIQPTFRTRAAKGIDWRQSSMDRPSGDAA